MTTPLTDQFRTQAAQLAAGETSAREKRLADALDSLVRDASNEEARLVAADCYSRLARPDEAAALLRAGLGTQASARLFHRLVLLLSESNQTEEAIALAQQGESLFPGDMLFRFKQRLVLPVLYDSTTAIGRWRTRYASGLDRLCEEIERGDFALKERAFHALGQHTNFYLPYQAENDRDLQIRYGRMVCDVMSTVMPQFAVSHPAKRLAAGEHLRVGYVSSRFADLSASRFFLGWLRGHDRTRFSVHAWHVGPFADHVTAEVAAIADHFDHLPGPVATVAESIRSRRLDALIFLDIGLHPLMTQLAALRLAPVQCMAWDHPVTSGLPTVDYALSGDLAEPDDGRSHYSEQLIRLPGIGVDYPRPLLPRPLFSKKRHDFGLREDAVVYLCCQSLFKYLPDHDRTLSRIARLSPRAHFVFVEPNPLIRDAFLRRAGTVFRDAGIEPGEAFVFLPRLSRLDYWNLQLLGDVFLDTVGWSSGGSVLDALACGVPVVTLRGRFMRGRQGSAMLRMLGQFTSADTPDTYSTLAAELGSNLHWRSALRAELESGLGRLFSNRESIHAIEDLLLSECREQ